MGKYLPLRYRARRRLNWWIAGWLDIICGIAAVITFTMWRPYNRQYERNLRYDVQLRKDKRWENRP